MSASAQTPAQHPDKTHTDNIQADANLAAAISASASATLSKLPVHAHRVTRTYQFLPYLALDVAPDALLLLRSDPRVISIHADIPHPLPGYESAGAVSQAGPGWDIPTPSAQDTDRPNLGDTISMIGADRAWARGYSGAGWHVAVLDSGIRRTHDFFHGKEIIEACFSSLDHCPNGRRSMTGTEAAAHHPSMYAGFDHGTHVAGIAVGRNSDGSLFGVARDAGIIAVNVFSKFPATEPACEGSPCILAFVSDQIAGLDHVYGLRGNHNIGAVNMSLGGGQHSSFCDAPQKYAIDLLRGANIPTTISTGNAGYCGFIGSPACVSSAVAVMASTKGDQETNFNNWHPTLGDIFAPGANILSSTGGSDTSYQSWDGTSMAAPHVAGAMTLMRQYQSTDSPQAHLTRLTSRGPSIPTLCGDGGSKARLYVDNFSTAPTSNWKTEVGIVNMASTPTSGTLRGFNALGDQVWDREVSLDAQGRISLDVSQAAGSDASRIRSMRLDIAGGLAAGYQKIYQPGKYRVGLEASPRPNQAQLFIPHIASNTEWETGIGWTNTTSTGKTLEFAFDSGQTATKMLPANGHDSFSISSLFSGSAASGVGAARVSNGDGVVGLMLFSNLRNETLSGVSLSDATSTLLHFPHVAHNAQWATGIVIYNPNQEPADLTFTLYNAQGVVLHTLNRQVGPYQRIVGSPDTLGFPQTTSWFSVQSSRPVTGLELFGTASGRQMAGFSVVNLAATQGVFPKIETEGSTGIAMVNIGNDPAEISLFATDNNGTVHGTRRDVLQPGAKVSDSVQSLFTGQNISRATHVRFASTQPIVGFQLNGSSDGTMLDAIPALGPGHSGSTVLYFPHISAQ